MQEFKIELTMVFLNFSTPTSQEKIKKEIKAK